MKKFLFPDKTENNISTKNKMLDLNFKSKNKKYNNNLDFFVPKKNSSRSNVNNDDSSIKLSNAYKNINLMLSSCLESIQVEEKDEKIPNPFFKNLLKKNEKSPNYKIALKDTLKENSNFNKSLTLSNSNILMKSSDDNILNNLNIDKEKRNAFKQNKNNFGKSISLKTTKNVKSKGKLDLILNKNTATSLFSPKRNQNKNQQQFLAFNPKKVEFDFNKEKIFPKFEKKKNRSTSKMQIIIKREEKDKENEINNLISSNFISNCDMSPKSIKKTLRSSKKSLNKHKKYRKSKTFVLSGKNLGKKDKEVFSNERSSSKKLKLSSHYSSLKNFSKYSLISETDMKNSSINQNNNSNNKRYKGRKSNTIIVTTKPFKNIITKSPRRSMLKNSIRHNEKDKLQILTLKEIGNNIRKTITEFDFEKLKKDLYDLETNQFTDIIKNLPVKNDDNKNTNINSNLNSKITSLNQTDYNFKCMTTINNEDDYLNKNEKEENEENLNRFEYKYRRLFLSKKVYDSLDDEEYGDEDDDNNYYLSPTSYTVYIIDFFVLISSFIQLFYLPYYLAYYRNICKDYFLTLQSILFYSSDLIYIIDLISGFFRAYYNFEEILIRHNLDICLNYLTGWFFIDLIEAVPFYTIINLSLNNCKENLEYFRFNYSGNDSLYYSLLVFKILKVFKAFSNNRVLNRIVHFFSQNDFFYNWKGVFFTLLVFLSSLHFCSCFFIFLGKNTYPGWIVLCNLQSNSFEQIYITSLYYLMTTLTTVGYGDISVSGKYERFYQIALLIVGTFAYSWILTFISNYIKKKNEKFINFENKLNILGEIRINYPNLNNDLYERILRYLNYNKSEYKNNVENILDSMPSSLQNNLIVEMYKPIISNFHFFKYFENSDFFVKIVTSLKPILSMKDDILVQEGDVIEDIIFIKRGILSLEILIDLDAPKESAEKHLNMTGIGCVNIFTKMETRKTIMESKFNNSYSIVSQNTNLNGTKNNSKFIITNKNLNNKKAMKIIDLRKNEHFGDVLMILNERSPLTVKVKSKKAELFFLQKTDATEISNQYPNIWKRIVNKSLYNMKQIKNLIQKKIMIFCELNDILLNPELKKKYLEENEINNSNDLNLINKTINKNKNVKFKKNDYYPKKQIESIIYEEDENFFDSMVNTYVLSEKNIKKDKKNSIASKCFSSKQLKYQRKSNDNLQLSSVSSNIKKKSLKEYPKSNKIIDHIKNNYNNKFLSEENSGKSNNENIDIIKKEKMTIELEDNPGKKTTLKNNSVCDLNNMMSIIDEKMKSTKGQINNFNINIFTPKTVQIPINQINNGSKELSESDTKNKNKHYEKDKNTFGINEELYYNEEFEISILKPNISLNNCDKNDDIIYPNIKRLLENEKNKNYDNSNIKKLLDKNKNDEDFENIEIMNNKNSENKNNSSKINKINKFLNLNKEKNISFVFYSIYENINKLSRYKFEKNSFLRQKTKAFILNNCITRQKSLENNCHIKKKSTVSNNSPQNKANFRSNNYNKNNSVIIRNKHEDELSSKNKNPKKKRIFSIDNGNSFSPIKRVNTNELNKFKKRKTSTIFRNRINKTILNSSIISQDAMYSYKNRNKKQNFNNTNTSEFEDDKDKNFYHKIKTFRRGPKNKEREKESSPVVKKLNLEERISQNIEKNKQNLNNPEEYFSGFFKNLLINKKTQKNQKTVNKDQKKASKYKRDNNAKSTIKKNSGFDFDGINNIRRKSTLNNSNIRSFRI